VDGLQEFPVDELDVERASSAAGPRQFARLVVLSAGASVPVVPVVAVTGQHPRSTGDGPQRSETRQLRLRRTILRHCQPLHQILAGTYEQITGVINAEMKI